MNEFVHAVLLLETDDRYDSIRLSLRCRIHRIPRQVTIRTTRVATHALILCIAASTHTARAAACVSATLALPGRGLTSPRIAATTRTSKAATRALIILRSTAPTRTDSYDETRDPPLATGTQTWRQRLKQQPGPKATQWHTSSWPSNLRSIRGTLRQGVRRHQWNPRRRLRSGSVVSLC